MVYFVSCVIGIVDKKIYFLIMPLNVGGKSVLGDMKELYRLILFDCMS